MIKDINIGQYIPGDSIIHILDPRTKIITTGMIVIGLFLLRGFTGYFLYTLFALIVLIMAKLSPKYVLRGLRPLLFIMTITIIAHIFMGDGRLLFKLGPLEATWEGLMRGVEMLWRLILLVLFTTLATLTTSPISLTDGIESLLSPGKAVGIPAHEIAMMMTIALRFIPTLLEEAEKIMKAQMARGADFETGSILRRAKSLVPLLVPLFVSAFRRADDLATAMESRCYRGGEGRTKLRVLKYQRADYIAGTISAGIVIAFGILF